MCVGCAGVRCARKVYILLKRRLITNVIFLVADRQAAPDCVTFGSGGRRAKKQRLAYKSSRVRGKRRWWWFFNQTVVSVAAAGHHRHFAAVIIDRDSEQRHTDTRTHTRTYTYTYAHIHAHPILSYRIIFSSFPFELRNAK